MNKIKTFNVCIAGLGTVGSNVIDGLIKNHKIIIQKTNNCFIKLFNHYDSSKIIIVSLLDNLLKGASGQAVQCMNIMFGYDEKLGLNEIKSD